MKPDEIKDLRQQKNLTQDLFGEICGVGKTTVSKWEKGQTKPSGAALKILHNLRDGDLVISEVSELEAKLLDQNIKVGGFKDREDYLTKSLKHLLLHGEFLSISDKVPENVTPIPRKKAHIQAAAGSEIEAEIIDWEEGSKELNVRIVGDSFTPLYHDGDIVTMAPRHLAKRVELAKGKYYLFRTGDGLKIKRYNTRKARPDERDEDYLTKYGTVGIFESLNSTKHPPEDITTPDVDWLAWLEKDGSYPKDIN